MSKIDLETKVKHKELEIEGTQKEIEEMESKIDNFEYSCTDSEFDEVLNCEGVAKTSVGEFYPSDILKNCDPVAYNCAKNDYESSFDLDNCEEYTDLKEELESLEERLAELEGELESLEEELENFEG